MRTYYRIARGLRVWPIVMMFIMGLFGIGNAETITYTYDSNGQLTKVDYGGGMSTTYTYDEAGNILSRVTVGGAPQYTLTVSKTGTGSGTVTSSPAGINCGSDCSEAYNQGTVVTLTATAASGSTFKNWSGGGCSGTGSCTVTMNTGITVTASFDAQSSQKINLTPYQPQGWSDEIVVTTTSAATTDSSPLYTTDTLYVDWAVINQGPTATTVRFCNNLYLDGTEKGSWCSDPPINAGIYISLKGLSIGSLSAGTHQLKIVADATGAIDESNEADNEYTKTITVLTPGGQLPNLTPFQPQGWSDKIVVSKTKGATTDSSPLYATDTLYVNWAVVNQGPGGVTTRFYTKLYVDDVEKQSWYSDPPLNANNYIYVNDFSIGSLSAGTHKIKIVADATGAVSESDEGDNEYTKTITVGASGKIPHISVSPALLDFGSVKVGKSASKTLKIANNGSGDLAITVDGLDGTDFSAGITSSITVKPKKSYSLKVSFKPFSKGPETALLEIHSNDPDTPTTEIPLMGTGK